MDDDTVCLSNDCRATSHQRSHSDEAERDVTDDDGGIVVEVDTHVDTADISPLSTRRTPVVNVDCQPVAISLDLLLGAQFVVVRPSPAVWPRVSRL